MSIKIISAKIVPKDTPTYFCQKDLWGDVVYDTRLGGHQRITWKSEEHRLQKLEYWRNQLKKATDAMDTANPKEIVRGQAPVIKFKRFCENNIAVLEQCI